MNAGSLGQLLTALQTQLACAAAATRCADTFRARTAMGSSLREDEGVGAAAVKCVETQGLFTVDAVMIIKEVMVVRGGPHR